MPEKAECSVEGCERPVVARKLCNMHYLRQRATGELGSVRAVSEGPERPCEVCGAMFRAYRPNAVTCSKECYRKLPTTRVREAGYKARPEVRERRNHLRRVEINPSRREVNLRQAIRRYGITFDRYEAMLAEQDGKCALCGAVPAPGGIKAAARLHVDHDHASGAVRSLLCNGCNRGLGYLKDSPELLRAAADYIERHRAPLSP